MSKEFELKSPPSEHTESLGIILADDEGIDLGIIEPENVKLVEMDITFDDLVNCIDEVASGYDNIMLIWDNKPYSVNKTYTVKLEIDDDDGTNNH